MRCAMRSDRSGRSGGARLALLAFLVELLADAVALDVGEVVDEELAVEMIHLVLQADREHSLEVALEPLAMAILGTDAHLRGALDLVEDAGDRQAPLLALRRALAAQDLGIHEHERLVVLLGDIDDEQPAADIDLRRREPDAGCGIHGLEHVVDQAPERLVECGDGEGALAQARVGVFEYRKKSHRVTTLPGPRTGP